MLRNRLSTSSLCAIFFLLLTCTTLYIYDTQAETGIETDGTLGEARVLAGPDYAINADLGQQRKGNLFHSFREFNIGTGDTATFRPPEGEGNIPITNVISRVTGGHRSDIDGTLKSEIPNADVYLINPAGIMFGPNASLDVPGSLHVSTAGELHLADGGKFNAIIPSNSLLTVAPPSAFGFLDNQQTSSITINESYLNVHEGKEMSFIGGKIEIINGSVLGETKSKEDISGRINLVAVEAKAQVMLIKPTEAEPDLKSDLIVAPSQAQKGEIKISDSNLKLRGEQGGQIFIRAGSLFLEQATFLYADATGDKPSLIDIAVDENMEVADSSEISIFDDVNTTAQGSLTKISAKNIDFHGIEPYQLTNVLLPEIVELSAEELSAAYHQYISLEEANLLKEDEFLQTSVKGLLEDSEKDGTEVSFDMVVEKLRRENVAGKYHRILSTTFSKIVNRSVSQKEAAGIQITADNLTINTGSVSSYTEGDGSAGNITVTADKVTLQEFGQLEATSSGKGNAGNINLVNVNNVLLEGDSRITTEATQARGGNITLNVRDRLVLFNSKITAKAWDNGGNLTINARPSNKLNELFTIDNSELRTDAFAGNGGNINIRADKYYISRDTTIEFSSELGLNGQFVLNSVKLSDALPLSKEKDYLKIDSLPLNRCSLPKENQSRFTITARDILPRCPEDLRTQTIRLGNYY